MPAKRIEKKPRKSLDELLEDGRAMNAAVRRATRAAAKADATPVRATRRKKTG